MSLLERVAVRLGLDDDSVEEGRELLSNALTLIESKDSWCQVYEALDATDRSVSASSVEAQSWCATGALLKAGSDYNTPPMIAALLALCSVIGDEAAISAAGQEKSSQSLDASVQDWNDSHRHGAVVRGFQRAIVLLDSVSEFGLDAGRMDLRFDLAPDDYEEVDTSHLDLYELMTQ